MSSVRIDFGHPVFRVDPFPAWSVLREAGPVHRDVSGAWFVVTYREVDQLLHDPRVGKDTRRLAGHSAERANSVVDHVVARWIECRLPGVHRAWRRMVLPGFTVKAANELRPWTRRTADALLAELPPGQPFDVMADFARRLPIAVMARVMGLQDADLGTLERWSRSAGDVLEPDVPAAIQTAGEAAFNGLLGCLRTAIERPRTPFMEHLVSQARSVLNTDQLEATALLLLMSGNDTVAHLIGSGWLALSRHPDQAALVRERPDTVAALVDEVLRYDGPACVVGRATYEPVRIDGNTIPAGSLLLLATGAANRDGAAFADPDRLWIGRKPNRHLAFGGGDHLCVGSGLATMTAEIALRSLLARFPHPACDEAGLDWTSSRYVRGPDRLPCPPQAKLAP
jgi:cytochrome P450